MKYFAHKGIDFEGYELQKNIWLCNFSGLTSVLLQLQWLHFCAPPILICNHDTGTLAISQTRWEMQIFKCFLIQYYSHWSSTMSKEHNMSQFIWNLIPLTSWFWHKLPEWPMLSTISVTKEEDWKKSWLTLGATSETRVTEPTPFRVSVFYKSCLHLKGWLIKCTKECCFSHKLKVPQSKRISNFWSWRSWRDHNIKGC